MTAADCWLSRLVTTAQEMITSARVVVVLVAAAIFRAKTERGIRLLAAVIDCRATSPSR